MATFKITLALGQEMVIGGTAYHLQMTQPS